MIVTVIGTGLIGGSIALDLKKRKFTNRVIGVDKSEENLNKALELGIIDKKNELEEAIPLSDLVIIATPVDVSNNIISNVLDGLKNGATVMDVGSIKSSICNIAENHPKRGQFVACHPMAGTEFSGPQAAHYYLFDGKYNVICDKYKSDQSALELVNELFGLLNMKTIYMDSKEHDRHIAFVSHLSHISSFTLGLTVLDIEKDEQNIFNMASTGFASTVRLAKSSPNMWTPILLENKKNLVEAIDSYMDKLKELKNMVQNNSKSDIYEYIKSANQIERILDGIELKNNEETINTL